MADSLDIKLEVSGDEQLKAMLSDLSLDVKDLRSAMRSVGDLTKKHFSGEVFTSRGQFIGESWPRLSDGYAAQKAKRFPGRPVLVRTGGMQQSFSYSTTAMSVTIRNTSPHFKYHQSTAARKMIPRRAMIGIYGGLQDEVTSVIAVKLAERLRKAKK